MDTERDTLLDALLLNCSIGKKINQYRFRFYHQLRAERFSSSVNVLIGDIVLNVYLNPENEKLSRLSRFRREKIFTKINGCRDSCTREMTNSMFFWIEAISFSCQRTTTIVLKPFQFDNLNKERWRLIFCTKNKNQKRNSSSVAFDQTAKQLSKEKNYLFSRKLSKRISALFFMKITVDFFFVLFDVRLSFE